MTIQTIINEREKTHGDFEAKSAFIQSSKDMMRRTPNWDALPPRQREALDMMAVKFGRFLFGDPTHEDHLTDLFGYLTLMGGQGNGEQAQER